MAAPARELSQQLAERAEAVCRHYLSNGYRSGAYWLVGDLGNAKGRSLFVRLNGGPAGRSNRGKWQDAATGEHGDLLDLIAAREGHTRFADTLAEARRFLGQPDLAPEHGFARDLKETYRATSDTTLLAKRIWGECRPICGTAGEAYLKGRGVCLDGISSIRFHPALPYRADDRAGPVRLPAYVVAVTDSAGRLTGIQRRWLRHGDRTGGIIAPRKSLGHLHGNGVWLRHGRHFQESGVIVAGEGVETVLSVAEVLRTPTLIACLSASHLAAFCWPEWCKRLLILQDNDPAGIRASRRLAARAREAGISSAIFRPVLKDFNADLRLLGWAALADHLSRQVPDLVIVDG
ncbi:MAG: toprim domain-containing protein [Proteobacteria bacterium]|nr:toprim domain-containing protein [Pseudomonadota bacterium]